MAAFVVFITSTIADSLLRWTFRIFIVFPFCSKKFLPDPAASFYK